MVMGITLFGVWILGLLFFKSLMTVSKRADMMIEKHALTSKRLD